ncbi:putative tRNA-dihydrouridine synthase [Borrelia miyamotoi]|uniref:tRNA-dihydrouridine synthase n=1 Tax=Borrelia miyamotoi TaxID=47466 RepID=A0AAP9CFT5_9SPIR|nr:tRNA-dihydrouridine synthase [Borrelia miyamotoi]AHH04664.1 TRNA-dihydrouridine synthase [Borrelia miyamotoi FR64b]ATQ14523.1 tRNA-dihydrouridine synthase [Borrelia miyamotoi]ATQ15708.1 tRNA-dihydrouridine synthase [Borrelia miyamotoi]ATQ16852.1 tRNA-dihydrouridine synthase [Borrelia miyamotoi]ATQ18644.1 tRNA-dihydrouridine synthase [Borrelia miyamotoi]
MNFLSNISRPIMILAPMEDVTDTVFRNLIHLISNGKDGPDIYFTEFISVKGLLNKSRQSIQHILTKNDELKRPLIAQIWGKDPDEFFKAIEILSNLGFWGIDLNMGCPKRKIVKKGVCSALINNKSLAREIIIASKEACLKFGLPLSVKTRHGFFDSEVEDWLGFLLKLGIDMLTVHPRLAINQSEGSIDVVVFGEVVKLRNQINPSTLVIGNGDILSLKQAHQIVRKYSIDGVMFGRGIFRNLNLFREGLPNFLNNNLNFRLNILKFHITDFHSTWGITKDFNKLKKYFKIYFNEDERDSEYFYNIMNSNNYDELFENLRRMDVIGDELK